LKRRPLAACARCGVDERAGREKEGSPSDGITLPAAAAAAAEDAHMIMTELMKAGREKEGLPGDARFNSDSSSRRRTHVVMTELADEVDAITHAACCSCVCGLLKSASNLQAMLLSLQW
jgi:hypothetical protein